MTSDFADFISGEFVIQSVAIRFPDSPIGYELMSISFGTGIQKCLSTCTYNLLKGEIAWGTYHFIQSWVDMQLS